MESRVAVQTKGLGFSFQAARKSSIAATRSSTLRNESRLQQAVPFELAQIVAELVQPVLSGGEMKGSEDGFMDLFGRRAADGVAAMQQDFEQPNNPGVMDFNAWNADGADGSGQGQPL